MQDSDLQRLAERQSSRPDLELIRAFGADSDSEPLANPVLAQQSLESVLAEALAARPETRTPEEAPDDAKRDAARLYTRGMSKLRAGEHDDAAADLEAATKLDPGAPALWRALGDAQAARKRNSAAERAYTRAVELGSTDPRPHAFLGKRESTFGDPEAAIGHLAAALSLGADRTGHALRPVLHAELGEVLIETGRLRAGIEAMRIGLDLPPRINSTTAFRDETTALYRQRAALGELTGNAALKLNEPELALEFFRQAARTPGPGQDDALRRELDTLLRLGRPAEAALTVLDQIRTAQPRPINASTAQTLEQLATLGRIGPEIDAELQALQLEPYPSLLGSLTRTRLAVLDPDDGDRVVMDHLDSHPNDHETLRAVLRARRDDPTRQLELAQTLTRAHPSQAGAVAQALVTVSPDPFVLLDRATAGSENADPDRSTADRMLRVHLLRELARPREAHALSVGLSDLDAAQALTKAEAAATVGDYLPVLELSDSWDDPSKTEDPIVPVRLALAAQRWEDALDRTDRALLLPELPASVRMELLLRGAQAAAELGDAPAARELLLEARELDPSDERSHAVLIALHSTGGPLQSGPLLTESVRDLRRAVPDSWLLRWLAAEQHLQRRNLDAAERTLLELHARTPYDPRVAQRLTEVWSARIDTGDTEAGETALAHFDAALASDPQSVHAHLARARILARTGEPERALQELEGLIATRPDPAASAVREEIIQVALKDRDRALRESVARLRLAPPTIETVLTRSSRELALGQLVQAVNTLEALDARVPLSSAQRRTLHELAASMARTAREDEVGDRAEQAARGLDIAAGMSDPFPQALHFMRLDLLSRPLVFDMDRIEPALRRAVREHPDLAPDVYIEMIRLINPTERARDTIDYCARFADVRLPDLYAVWAQSVVAAGDRTDGRAFADLIVDADGFATFFELLNADVPDYEPTRQRSELLYTLGNIAMTRESTELAVSLYREALDVDPQHGWAANNLAYELIERGGDLGEAEQLLEMAFSRLPDEPSVIDSLGWLRYTQGRFDSPADPENDPHGAGALALLQLALRTFEDGEENPTILDHLGDTLYRLGKRDEADEAWLEALRLLRTELERSRRESSDTAETRQRIRSISAKRRAALEGDAAELLAPSRVDPEDGPPVVIQPEPSDPTPVPAPPSEPPNEPTSEPAGDEPAGDPAADPSGS